MIPVFEFQTGDSPLLISVPHDGCEIPPEISDRMTDVGRSIPDTDWHVAELYSFAKGLGATTIKANYSRYVVDLNRAANDAELYPGQTATGLCPHKTFAGENIYSEGDVGETEKADRVSQYWSPYHEKIQSTLQELKDRHGYALLWDAHSIPGLVPLLFDGELPELNLGSNSSLSCAADIEGAVAKVAIDSSYSSIVNGRFKGGYITRNYGTPENNIHALQLEIAQRAYMDEGTLAFDQERAGRLRDILRSMLQSYLDTANK